MKRTIVAFAVLLMLPAAAQAFDWQWKKISVDASRTGVGMPSVNDVEEKMGHVEAGSYHAPGGRVFRGGVTPAVASLMIGAQPAMREMKSVVGHAARDLGKEYPESALTDLIVDCLMAKAERVVGRKVDVGIMNFGGIRVDICKGDILMDDVVSMLPFTNYICYLEVRGVELRRLFSEMAAGRIQVIGGARITVSGHGLESVSVGGKPLEDDRTYGVATIDFLLDGGDDISVARNALSLVQTDVLVREALLDYLAGLRADGVALDYNTDGRVTIR